MSTNYADLQREHDAVDTALRVKHGAEYSLLTSEQMRLARIEWLRNDRGVRNPQLAVETHEEDEHAYVRSLRAIGKGGATAILAALLSFPAFPAEPCRINVNAASPAQLNLFARTGPVLAGRLASGRPYKRLEDVDGVKGVGPAWLAVNGPHVAFSGPTTCAKEIPAPKTPKVPAPSPLL